MTTYTAIPDSDIDPDSPITTSLMTLVRDNPIAITEGSGGAPKIQTAGITDGAVTSVKLKQPAVGANNCKTLLGSISQTGTNISYPSAGLVGSLEPIGTGQFFVGTAVVTGTIRLFFNGSASGGTSSPFRILVNGVSVDSVIIGDAGAAETLDVPIVAGNNLVFQVKNNTSGTWYLNSLAIGADASTLCVV